MYTVAAFHVAGARVDYREDMIGRLADLLKRRFFVILIAADLILAVLLVRAYMAPDCREGALLMEPFVSEQMYGDILDTFIACAGSERAYALDTKMFVPREQAQAVCKERGCCLWTQGSTKRKRDVCYCRQPPAGAAEVMTMRRCYKVVFKDILGIWSIEALESCDASRDFCCRL